LVIPGETGSGAGALFKGADKILQGSWSDLFFQGMLSANFYCANHRPEPVTPLRRRGMAEPGRSPPTHGACAYGVRSRIADAEPMWANYYMYPQAGLLNKIFKFSAFLRLQCISTTVSETALNPSGPWIEKGPGQLMYTPDKLKPFIGSIRGV